MRRLLVLFSFIFGIACYSADWYTGPEVDGYERYGSYSDMSGWFEFPPGEYFAIWLDASGDHGHGHALFLDHECYDHVHAPEGHTCPETGICPYSIGHHTSYSFKGKFSAGRYWFWFDDGDFQIFRKTTCDLCGKKIESGSKHKQVCPVVSGAFYCGEESEHVSTFTCHNGIAHKVCSHISYQYQVPCGYPLKNLETCQITICQLCGETHESAKHGDGDTGGSGGSGGSGSGDGGDGGGTGGDGGDGGDGGGTGGDGGDGGGTGGDGGDGGGTGGEGGGTGGDGGGTGGDGGGTGGDGGGTGGDGGDGGDGGGTGGDGGDGGNDPYPPGGNEDPPPKVDEGDNDGGGGGGGGDGDGGGNVITAPSLDDWALEFEGPVVDNAPSDSDIKSAVTGSAAMDELHKHVDDLTLLGRKSPSLEFPLKWTGLVDENPVLYFEDYENLILPLRNFLKVIVYVLGGVWWFQIILKVF